MDAANDKSVSKERDEYDKILIAFYRLIENYENSADRLDIIEDIITLRASFLIDRALTGLRIDFDNALSLLRNFNNSLTEREKQQRDILVAAIENLVDFAAAEEYQMISELPEEINDDLVELEHICKKYNLSYANQENNDVLYAATIAAWWLNVSEESLITFMTQGDERVRPWHLSFEGLTYRKHEFPPELIPPIEWGCRCYLLTNGFGSVHGNIKENIIIRAVNPIFSESLAKCGRIFSLLHPYFASTLPDYIEEIKMKVKTKLFL